MIFVETAGCDMPGLITDWDGTASGYGEGIKELLANRP